jgi:periplasmic protein TonB
MPAELLRDVVNRRGSRAPRHWSVLPLSIAAHIAAAIAVFIIPLAADVELPVPSRFAHSVNIMQAHPVPPEPQAVRTAPSVRPNPGAAPVDAPEGIAKEDPQPSGGGDPSLPPGSGVGVSNGVAGGFGEPIEMKPLLPPPPPQAKSGPYRVGEGIREPRKIVHVAPVYPEIARNARVEGVVILEAIISVRGTVENVRVLRSHALLERAAVDAVRQWRYTPTLLNGVPVPVLITITVNFTLQH